jgi:hypothetical protein
MFAYEIAPPGVVAELSAAEFENRIKLDRYPTGFVSPVLEQWFARLQQFLYTRGIESVKPRQQEDRVTACSGDRHGIELQISETLDYPTRRRTRTLTTAFCVFRKVSPFRFQQAGTSKCESSGFSYAYVFHAAVTPVMYSVSTTHCI